MRVKREDIVASRELGSKLRGLGWKLREEIGAPRPSKASLLKMLEDADTALVSTEKAPLASALESMQPFLKAIVKPSLLKHQDKDVLLLVTSCLCEITRITAPNLPYSDEIMKDIFGLIVSTFSGLNDSSEPSFRMRVRVLEVLAKPKVCLAMLYLGCDDLVTETFLSFIAFARDDHPVNVISFMETIMVMLVEKSEDDVQDDNLLALLSSLGWNKNNSVYRTGSVQPRGRENSSRRTGKNRLKQPKTTRKDTTEAARNLAISVINRCSVKLEPALKQLLISLMSGNSGSSECQIDYHEVILDLYRCSPGILSGIVPYLTAELSANQSETRLRALRLVGELFTIPGHAIPAAFQPILTEFLNLLTDREVEVRMTALDYIKRFERDNLANKRLIEEISPGDDVNFKRARYNKSNKSDESNSDVSVLTPMASAQEQTKNESNSGEEKVDCDNTTILEPIYDANVALIEGESHEPGEDSISITRLECVPNSLQSLFHTPVPDFVHRAVVDGVKAIAEAISHFSENPRSARSEIFDNLEALKSVAKVAKVSDSRISWIVSQVNGFFNGVDAVVELEGEVSPTTLREVSGDLSLCDVEIASDERELYRLQDRSHVMKEREKTILEMEAKLCKMKEDLAADTEELVKCTSEVERRIQLNKEKKQGLEETEKAKKAEKAKLEELNLKRALIQTIARDLSSFASND